MQRSGFAESELARLLIYRGDHAEAETLLARIREWGEAMAEPVSVLNGAILVADSRLRQGAIEEGLQLLDATEADAREMAEVFGPVLARLRGRGLAALGLFDEALAQIEQGLLKAREQGLLYDQAVLIEVRTEIVASAGGNPDPNDMIEADRLFGELGVRREPALEAFIS